MAVLSSATDRAELNKGIIGIASHQSTTGHLFNEVRSIANSSIE